MSTKLDPVTEQLIAESARRWTARKAGPSVEELEELIAQVVKAKVEEIADALQSAQDQIEARISALESARKSGDWPPRRLRDAWPPKGSGDDGRDPMGRKLSLVEDETTKAQEDRRDPTGRRLRD